MSCDYHTGALLDEEVFADGKVNFIGQIIGMIVAKGQPLAQRAAKLVKVTYEDLPSVITIEVLMLSYIASGSLAKLFFSIYSDH